MTTNKSFSLRILTPLCGLLITTIIATIIGCYNVKTDCRKFKTGRFIFKAEIDGEIKTTIFERNDSLEISFFKNKYDTSTVKWINNCEYILRKLHPKSNSEKKSIQVKIIQTTDSGYNFEYHIVGKIGNKQRGYAAIYKD